MHYYQDSNYMKQMRQAETDRFDRQMREQRLKELFEADALDTVQLDYKDREYVEQLREEAALQAKHDAAFLEGFLNGGKRG